MNALLPLVTQLKACPSLENRITEKKLLESWKAFRNIDPEHGDELNSAVIVGLILHDEEGFAPLLTSAEHTQLEALARKAYERYQQLTHPPNHLGKLLAATLKESI